jgi:hypothetical protein
MFDHETQVPNSSASTKPCTEQKIRQTPPLDHRQEQGPQIQNIFVQSEKDSQDPEDHSDQIRLWELEAKKLIAQAPSQKRDRLQKVCDN